MVVLQVLTKLQTEWENLRRGPKKERRKKSESHGHVQLFAIPWTVAFPAPLSLGFYRQEYWSVLPFPSPRHLPDPGIEPESLALQANSSLTEP